MNVLDFFEKSTGTWSVQRTTHHLAFKMSEAGESEVNIQALGPTDAQVAQVCAMHEFDASDALGGAYFTWGGTVEFDEKKHAGETTLVAIPDPEDPQQGQILRDKGYAQEVPAVGRYQINPEGVLTVVTPYQGTEAEEKVWFVTPNCRARVSLVRVRGGVTTMTFCSEIRRLSPEEVNRLAAEINLQAGET
ncbi:phycobiliprotein lyase [Candidatus Cyanaurora vandensis]|uniref:phycobiliprotein lyase n=1 Tax=Candidatus Cyanaurora vandensis TaxID=2714958 RepID=UPI00257F191B|nr:phycobiliprotein lyase [Candidatus Cyanaurora vandensis]